MMSWILIQICLTKKDSATNSTSLITKGNKKLPGGNKKFPEHNKIYSTDLVICRMNIIKCKRKAFLLTTLLLLVIRKAVYLTYSNVPTGDEVNVRKVFMHE